MDFGMPFYVLKDFSTQRFDLCQMQKKLEDIMHFVIYLLKT